MVCALRVRRRQTGRPRSPPGESGAATGPITTVLAPRPAGGRMDLADEVGDCPTRVMHGCGVSVRGSAMARWRSPGRRAAG